MIKLNIIFYFGLFICTVLSISPRPKEDDKILDVKIVHFDVPSYHVISTDPPEPLLLKCDYEYDFQNLSGVLKWKHQGNLVYQWMINRQKPTIMETFKTAVDADYEASTDPYKKYSSVAIMTPKWNMSGHYECSISVNEKNAKPGSTSAGYTSAIQDLTIIDIRNYSLNIDPNEKDDDIEISCRAENVYPKPDLKLRLNQTSSVYIKNQEFSKSDDGYYDVEVDGIIKNDGSINNLTCIMTFPNTNFEMFQTLEGNSSNRLNSATLLLTTMILLIFIIFNK